MARHILPYRLFGCSVRARLPAGARVALVAVAASMVLATMLTAGEAPSQAPSKAASQQPSKAAAPGATQAAKAAAAGAPAAAPSAPLGPADAVYPKRPAEMEPIIRADPLRFLQTARDWSTSRIQAYTCQFQKLERIDGELRKPETMRMKFRNAPFSVYLKWIVEPSKDQEAIFVRAAHDDKAVVHPPGLLGAIFRKVSIDPEGKTARKHSRRPITVAGMGYMVDLVTGQCEDALTRGDLTLTYEGIRNEGGRPLYLVKRVLPKDKGYPCETLLIFIDCETLACVRTDGYDWGGELISHYFYTDLSINPGLTDDDFDPDNRDYGYRLF